VSHFGTNPRLCWQSGLLCLAMGGIVACSLVFKLFDRSLPFMNIHSCVYRKEKKDGKREVNCKKYCSI
jgi:hypothetical protein